MKHARRPTMRDVALEAGVSFKTVSRVVNGEVGVSADLTQLVEVAVEKLGYLPDQRARGLRRSNESAVTIGFVLVDVANPFFGSLLRGIEEVATARSCLVLAGSTAGSTEREHQLIDAFVGRRVDGLIVVSSGADTRALQAEIDRGTPVVFVDVEPNIPDVDIVRSDHFEGARAATSHLLRHGHVDVAYMGDDPALYSARLRLAGFQRAMEESQLEVVRERVITGSHTEAAWRSIALEHLSSSPLPTAIFSAQNFATLGAARALHELGLEFCIAQIGFDDIDLADVVRPAISVVPQNPRDLGRQAAELLFERIDGDPSPAQRQIVPVSIVERGSGELPLPR